MAIVIWIVRKCDYPQNAGDQNARQQPLHVFLAQTMDLISPRYAIPVVTNDILSYYKLSITQRASFSLVFHAVVKHVVYSGD